MKQLAIYFNFVSVALMLCCFLFICGCDGGDDDNDIDDDTDDDTTPDDDDDTTQPPPPDDDDDTIPEGSPPQLSNPYIFPDVPIGEHGVIDMIWDMCDEDGDLSNNATLEFFWATDGSSVWGVMEIGDYFEGFNFANCMNPPTVMTWYYGLNNFSPSEYEMYLIATDEAGNESDPLYGFTFWVPEESEDSPVITDPDITYSSDKGFTTLTFDICDPDNDLIGGYLSLMWPYYWEDIRYVLPALGDEPYFVSWPGMVPNDISDCENPATVVLFIDAIGFNPGEYCFDMIGTDSEHHASDYFMDLCFVIPDDDDDDDDDNDDNDSC